MIKFKVGADICRVAGRVVWYRPPAEAIADPYHFLAHLMTFGTLEDLRVIEPLLSKQQWRDALKHAPPGIFDPRSWAYWHLRWGLAPPPLPTRRF
jgi:hypothetical protein